MALFTGSWASPAALGVTLTGLLLAAAPVAGQVNSDLINEQLDKQLSPMELNAALPQVMQQLSDATNVPIRAMPQVWESLPWGKQTNVKTGIKNQTLREALNGMTRALGLQWEMKDGEIELQPLPAMLRLGKRVTAQELDLLKTLSNTPLTMDPNARPTMRQIIETVDAQLAAMKTEYVVENRAPQPPASAILETIIPVKRNATMAEALETIATSTTVTWYPWGKSVVVLPKEDVIRQLLQKPVTLRNPAMDVGQALLDLSKAANVPFQIEPGAVTRIPPEYRSVKLIADSASVQQVLEQLSATTGVGYVVTDKGVYIWNNSPIPNAGGSVASGSGGNGGRTALLVPTPSGQLVVPESEMPDDVRAYLKKKREDAFSAMREEMRKEKFVAPATQPGT